MIRCFLPADQWADEVAELGESESKHLISVLRKKEGAQIEILDGAGRTGTAEVVAPHKKRTTIRIHSQSRAAPFVPRRILVQSLVREQKMDWLIQKAVELGVHEIRPIQTEQTVVRIRPEDAAKKAARWQAIALSACKQSGNPWMPLIHPVRSLKVEVAAPSPGAACFGALQDQSIPLSAYFSRLHEENCPQVTMWIGPEGDFSPAEVEALLAAGIQPVTFGPIIFRVETAALFICSALQYAWL